MPASLPGLLHARKVQRRAAAVGFDWPGLEGPLAKMREELDEIDAELARAGRPAPETEADPRVFDEVGDLLFTVVNVARRRERRPRARPARDEPALRRARRARRAACRRRPGETWAELDLDAQEAWYDAAKVRACRRPGRSALRLD